MYCNLVNEFVCITEAVMWLYMWLGTVKTRICDWDSSKRILARQVCKEAEIEVVSRDSMEQLPTQYLTKGRPDV